MKIDFHELARIEKQDIPPAVAPHFDTLNAVVNAGIQTLANLASNVRNNPTMRKGRLNPIVQNWISPSNRVYEAVQFASKLLKSREQAMNNQLVSLQQSLKEHIPTHEAELQQQLADATLSGDTKAADKAIEGLQKLRQRTTEKGELANRAAALETLLRTFQQVGEVINAIQWNIQPLLWLKHAENLKAEYLQQREQIAAFVDLHHQIMACEWMGKDANHTDYVSPLSGTAGLFGFDQLRHKQAFEALRPVVLPD